MILRPSGSNAVKEPNSLVLNAVIGTKNNLFNVKVIDRFVTNKNKKTVIKRQIVSFFNHKAKYWAQEGESNNSCGNHDDSNKKNNLPAIVASSSSGGGCSRGLF